MGSKPCRNGLQFYIVTWLIEHSDYVITYVTHDLGSGAAQFKALAEKSHKTVIELSDK